jgi:hypothetical protein
MATVFLAPIHSGHRRRRGEVKKSVRNSILFQLAPFSASRGSRKAKAVKNI